MARAGACGPARPVACLENGRLRPVNAYSRLPRVVAGADMKEILVRWPIVRKRTRMRGRRSVRTTWPYADWNGSRGKAVQAVAEGVRRTAGGRADGAVICGRFQTAGPVLGCGVPGTWRAQPGRLRVRRWWIGGRDQVVAGVVGWSRRVLTPLDPGCPAFALFRGPCRDAWAGRRARWRTAAGR